MKKRKGERGVSGGIKSRISEGQPYQRKETQQPSFFKKRDSLEFINRSLDISRR